MVILLIILLLLVVIFTIRAKKFNLKNIKKNKLIIIIVIVILVTTSMLLMNKYKYKFVKIDDNYYAVLSGGSGELVNRTYLYMDNGKRYRYIQTTSTTESWGSDKWSESVTKVGYINWPGDVIEIAKNNNSDGFVTINVDVHQYKKGDIITIDELDKLIAIK